MNKISHGVIKSISTFFEILIKTPIVLASLALNLLKSLVLLVFLMFVWTFLVGIPASLVELHKLDPIILFTSKNSKITGSHYPSIWIIILIIIALIMAAVLIWFAFSQTYETWIKKPPYRYIPSMNYDSAPEHHQKEYHQDEVHDEPTEPIQSSEETPYDILGVSPTDDLETIKRVYRNLSKTYHPDVNSSQHAAEMTVKINNAWEQIQLEKTSE